MIKLLTTKNRFILFSVFVLLISSLPIRAQSGFNVNIGGNYSNFRTTNSDGDYGIVVGIGYEKELAHGFALDSKFLLTGKQAHLNNKNVSWTFEYLQISGGDVYNLHAEFLMFDIPITAKYYFPSYKKLRFFIDYGVTFSLAFSDKSNTEKLSFVDEDPLIIDYYPAEEAGSVFLNNSTVCANYGFGFNYKNFSLGYYYTTTNQEIDLIDSIIIDEKLYSHSLLLTISM